MGPYLQKQLVKLCELPLDQKWKLKYRASRDGFKSTDFHSKCDGIANTLTVIKAKSGNIFGGFTEQKWHSRDGVVTDPKAFIFSLVNKEERPFKVLCSNEGKQAICCDSRYGPCFGGEGRDIRDIFINTNSNIKMSFSDFGHSYQHPDYLKGTATSKSILAGSKWNFSPLRFGFNYEFETVEIEVFSKTK